MSDYDRAMCTIIGFGSLFIFLLLLGGYFLR